VTFLVEQAKFLVGQASFLVGRASFLADRAALPVSKERLGVKTFANWDDRTVFSLSDDICRLSKVVFPEKIGLFPRHEAALSLHEAAPYRRKASFTRLERLCPVRERRLADGNRPFACAVDRLHPRRRRLTIRVALCTLIPCAPCRAGSPA
jgi:hypothetical protein